ncbi:hypothetical protein [Aridibaculum aurantiacum]|uniref:hypothetical protein n=1 Tax=Aridibaculum aurantiacum TaxID=2810307 RepID=UPI001A96E132|nr:hypothetical protein [Aridibaculum aurantiacum]
MSANKNLQFIASKILDTEVALFHCLTNSILRVPNTVIKTLKVDDEGHIYFFVARPQQLISEFDQEFPVSLNYFKKGKSYTLQIFGTARMLTNAEEITEEIKLSSEEVSNALCTQLLIKVKIRQVEFCDLAARRQNMFQRLKASVLTFLHWAQPMERQYNFSAGSRVNYGF